MPRNRIDYKLAATVVNRLLKEGKVRDEDTEALETFVYEAKALANEEDLRFRRLAIQEIAKTAQAESEPPVTERPVV